MSERCSNCGFPEVHEDHLACYMRLRLRFFEREAELASLRAELANERQTKYCITCICLAQRLKELEDELAERIDKIVSMGLYADEDTGIRLRLDMELRDSTRRVKELEAQAAELADSRRENARLRDVLYRLRESIDEMVLPSTDTVEGMRDGLARDCFRHIGADQTELLRMIDEALSAAPAEKESK